MKLGMSEKTLQVVLISFILNILPRSLLFLGQLPLPQKRTQQKKRRRDQNGVILDQLTNSGCDAEEENTKETKKSKKECEEIGI